MWNMIKTSRLHHVDLSRCSDEMVTLFEDSREVVTYIAGYVAKKTERTLW